MQRFFCVVKIMSLGSVYYGQVQDILVVDGIIKVIGVDFLVDGVECIELMNVYVFLGWVDFEVEGGDFGLEYCEDMVSLLCVVVVGGYIYLGVCFKVDLLIYDKSGVYYLL